MTDVERAAYWLYWSRRHEFRCRQYLIQLHDVRDALRAGDATAALAMIDVNLPSKNRYMDRNITTTSTTNP